MANLTITVADVAPVEIIEQSTAPASEALNAGMCVAPVAATGQWQMVNATTAGAAGNRRGLALRSADHVRQAVTALHKGVIYLGDALDGLDFDAPVYLSDTDGLLADADDGTVDFVIGHVVPIFAETGTPKKALRLDL